ncbi:MAG: type IV toxin-antitoxin system AbiEi family antitoxin domain-containing protein [Ilumatobacteraceae bacterium]
MPSTDVKLQRLDSIAQRHHGLVSLERAQAAGISRSTWYRALASGQFEQLTRSTSSSPAATS